MKWMITGDNHGSLDRFESFFENYTGNPSEVAIIILGDAGFNYYMKYRDNDTKERACSIGCKFYCVRGNHEARPSDVPGMIQIIDNEVNGVVYYQPQYPNILYFVDGEVYTINGYKTLILGGAYSVDKEYRQLMHWQWFANEQLTADEMRKIENKYAGEVFDLILAHTCPYSWEPRDLFLGFIDQSKVDDSMERWMEYLLTVVGYKVFMCGHFHADRQIAPGAYMMFEEIKYLDHFMNMAPDEYNYIR